MGKQYNKVEKKRRRSNYLIRRKAKALAAGKGVKARAKKPAKKKAAPVAAQVFPAAVASATAGFPQSCD